MLHHLSFGTADLARAATFYDATLAALGYARVWSSATEIGYGYPGAGDRFAIKFRTTGVAVPGQGLHAAFAAPNRESVDRFHQAALRHGGKDNGAPGLRPDYGDSYYAAFVIDPDGYQIEAVTDAPLRSGIAALPGQPGHDRNRPS
ncbi:MAG: VOC family protein [Burkholderiales bacterium]|jgi:catechol 2,3-dioxygenase-like lactoylglutathione lyase family enzyme